MLLLLLCNCKKNRNDTDKIDAVVTDIDGNVYHTVKIGDQIWMAENLKTSKYRDSSPISFVADYTTWKNTTLAAYCYYNNDATIANTYGYYYNWYAVNNTHNIAPIGWHVATDADWTILTSYLGGDSIAGIKLKEKGFAALPGGYRVFFGNYANFELYGFWWCSTETNNEKAWLRFLGFHNNYESIIRLSEIKLSGCSVRCVKD